jgi:hypothetical protein
MGKTRAAEMMKEAAGARILLAPSPAGILSCEKVWFMHVRRKGFLPREVREWILVPATQ